MQKLQNTTSAKLMKSRSLEDIFKAINPSKCSLFDLTLGLRNIANHLKTTGIYASPQDLLQIAKRTSSINKRIMNNFQSLQGRDLCNLVYSIKIFNTLGLNQDSITFTLSHHQKVMETMNNRAYSVSQSIQIYYDMWDCDQFIEQYDTIIIGFLKNENIPMGFLDIRLIIAKATDRLSYRNREILDLCFGRLEKFFYFSPGLVREVIELLKLIEILENKVVYCDTNKLLEKMGDYLRKLELSIESLVSILQCCVSPKTNQILVHALLKFTEIYLKNPDAIQNSDIFLYLESVTRFPESFTNNQSTILQLISQKLNSSSDIDKGIFLCHLISLTKDVNASLVSELSINDCNVLINLVKCLSNLENTETIVNKLLEKSSHITPISSDVEHLFHLITILAEIRLPERYEGLEILEKKIIENFHMRALESHNYRIFSRLYSFTESQLIRKKVDRTWVGSLKTGKTGDQIKYAKKLIMIFNDDPRWYHHAEELAENLSEKEFSELLNTSFVKRSSWKGFLHIYRKVPRKSYKDIASVISTILEYSLLAE